MVIALILNFIADIFATLLSMLGTVGLQDIPVIGDPMYTYLNLAVGYVHGAILVLPFMSIVWWCFVYVILPFEFTLLLAKVFFGSRLPAHLNQ